MDNRIREAIEGLLQAANRNVGGMVPGVVASWCHNALALLDAPVASDARELALELAAGMWEPDTLYVGARNKWLTNAAELIESFAADRERKVRKETARKCAEAVRNAIFDFGIGRGASNTYSPIMRRDMAVQLAERAIMEAAHE